MKMQLIIYLLCFVAVASVALRAEPNGKGPLFGGTAGDVFEVTITDQPMSELIKIKGATTQLCEKRDCPSQPNAAIQAATASVQP